MHSQILGNSRYARVILGAYLGRPMLKYRLAIDVYFRFVTLANVHLRSDMLKPENREKIAAFLKRKRHKDSCNKWNCKCLRDLGLTYLRDTSCLNPILKGTKKFEVGGLHKAYVFSSFYGYPLLRLLAMLLIDESVISVYDFQIYATCDDSSP